MMDNETTVLPDLDRGSTVVLPYRGPPVIGGRLHKIRRVLVQLMPKLLEGAFISALKAAQKNPKLRIHNMRCSNDLSKVVEHCRRRWKDQLDELGDPPFQLFHAGSHEPIMTKEAITIQTLCEQAGVPTAPDAKLTLTYTVGNAAGGAASTSAPSAMMPAQAPIAPGMPPMQQPASVNDGSAQAAVYSYYSSSWRGLHMDTGMGRGGCLAQTTDNRAHLVHPVQHGDLRERLGQRRLEAGCHRRGHRRCHGDGVVVACTCTTGHKRCCLIYPGRRM